MLFEKHNKLLDSMSLLCYNIIITYLLYDVNNNFKEMYKMNNQDIKEAAKKAKIKLWQIADKLGINDGNFSRKLRKELSQEEKQKIFDIIADLENEQKGA